MELNQRKIITFLLVVSALLMLNIGLKLPETVSKQDRWYYNEYEYGKESKDWISSKEYSLNKSISREIHAVEKTQYLSQEPKRNHYQKAWRLYDRTYNAMKERGLFDLKKARKEGYVKYDNLHWVKRELYFDNSTLEPMNPESLIYVKSSSNNSSVLAGVMYVTGSLESNGLQFAGPLSIWHFHPRDREYCERELYSLGDKTANLTCENSSIKKRRSKEMIHVWFIKKSEGPFATNMNVNNSELISSPQKMEKKEFMRQLKKEEY